MAKKELFEVKGPVLDEELLDLVRFCAEQQAMLNLWQKAVETLMSERGLAHRMSVRQAQIVTDRFRPEIERLRAAVKDVDQS